MRRNTLPRHRAAGPGGWSHPYGHHAFSPALYADGGNGDPGTPPAPAAPPAAPPAPPAPAAPPTPTQPAPPTPANPWDGFQWDGKVDSLPDPVAKMIRDLRTENAATRTNAKETAAAEARDQLLRELGLVKDNEPADPAALSAAIGEKDTRIGELETQGRMQAIELAAYKTAAKHDANPAALLDSRSFLTSVEGLDPTADDFTQKLDDAIKAAVEANQQLRAGQAPRRGGGEFNGGPGAREGRPASLSQALSRRFTGAS